MTQALTMQIPSDFPLPRFGFGQVVEANNTVPAYAKVRGRIVGLEYFSPAATSIAVEGWRYTVEIPAFTHSDPHHLFSEDKLQPIPTQEVTV